MSINTVNVNIQPQKGSIYPIFIGENILNNFGDLVKQYTKAKKLLIVTNEKVYSLYGEEIKKSAENENLLVQFVFISDGEKYKNLQSFENIQTEAIKFRLERKDAIVALGGGVIGDLTGFCAASYLRGVDFIQIPTTLLAQVDSSVGGKVGVNHKEGKNLIGAFYQPKVVLIDIKTLKSLPEEQLKVGLSEVLKYGFIEKTCNLSENNTFIQYLKRNIENLFSYNTQTLIETVEHCCKLKAAVVNQDEKESGLRAILNLGHTIGHAIEKCTNYELFNHGEAVAIGMVGVFYISLKKGSINQDYFNSSLELINDYKLVKKIPSIIKKEDLLDAMRLDKKVLSNKIRFILPIGEAEVSIIDDIEDKLILEILKNLY